MSNFIVTITGADDEVDPASLVELSKEYPFVEWAILFSQTQNGQARYPTKAWRSHLYAEAMGATHPVNFSAHICGSFTETILELRKVVNTELDLFYQRIQFNKFNTTVYNDIIELSNNTDIPIIVPYNSKTCNLVKSIEKKERISVLFDASGGNGVAPKEWPHHMQGTKLCGYAGGIDEVNCVDVVTRLGARYNNSPFWIDLETGARTEDNHFDLEKVKRILERVKPFHGANRIILANGL